MIFGQEGGSLIAPIALAAHPLQPIDKRLRNSSRKPVGWMICCLLMTFVPVQKLCVNIYMDIYIYMLYMSSNCVLLSDDNSSIPGCL